MLGMVSLNEQTRSDRHMRRLLGWLLVIALVVPMAAACVPSGYEGENPTRPEDLQVDVDELEGQDGTQAPDQQGQTDGTEEGGE